MHMNYFCIKKVYLVLKDLVNTYYYNNYLIRFRFVYLFSIFLLKDLKKKGKLVGFIIPSRKQQDILIN